MSAKPTDDGDDVQLVTTDCGHEVPKEKTCSVPEIVLCEECYNPAAVHKWPKVLNSNKSFAGQNYHGSPEYHTTETRLLGLDRRGRAVYWDQGESSLKYVVPMNDYNYREDREEYRNRTGRDLRALRKHHVGPEPDPGNPGKFHTLPNNDHITVVDREPGPFRKYEYKELRNWLQENTDDWQAVHPEMVEKFELHDRFGRESGQPLVDKECTECDFRLNSIDPVEYTECPDCGYFRFYEVMK